MKRYIFGLMLAAFVCCTGFGWGSSGGVGRHPSSFAVGIGVLPYNYNSAALSITKNSSYDSGIDITGDGTGDLFRMASNASDLGSQRGMFRTWFDKYGMLNTQGWINMHAPACTWNADGSLSCTAPTSTGIPYAISIWTDIPGHAIEARSSGMSGAGLLINMDGNGTVRQRLEDSGEIWWGPSGTAVGHDNPYTNVDTSVGRNTDATLGFNSGITIGKENLHTYSDTLTNGAWQPLNVSVESAAGILDPEGFTTAYTVTETADTGYHFLQNTATATCSGVCTSSALIKANTRQWAFLSLRWGGTDYFAWFDLLNGVLGSVDANLTATITTTRNGWYLCSVTNKTAQDISSPFYGVANANGAGSYAGDITKSLYMSRLQFVKGSAAGPRATTTTTPIINTTTAKAGTFQRRPVSFASLPACTSAIEGRDAAVSDSSTATWGSTVTAGGANHILAYCNGSAWTVAAK